MSRRRAEALTKSLPREDWCTPQSVLDIVHAVWEKGIALDPCWNQNAITNPTKAYHFDSGEDGLLLPWEDRTFVNPPYSRSQNIQWAKKALMEYQRSKGEQIVLVPASFGAKWFEHYLTESAVALLGRVQFIGAAWKSDFDLALVYRGRNPLFYASVCKRKGFTVVRKID